VRTTLQQVWHITPMSELTTRYERWSERLLHRIAPLLPSAPRLDIHVHWGIDADTGEEMTLEAIERQLDNARVQEAVLIPLNASDQYESAHRELPRICSQSDRDLRWLCRADPAADDLRRRIEQALDDGAVGVKLHPQSDEAHPEDPRLTPVLELVSERNALVLCHVGIDVDGTSMALLRCAERYPGAQFVIGHVAADALAEVAERIGDIPNVRVCTAWWGAADLAWALSWSDPARFVFGSDPPFGSVPLGLAMTSTVARIVGYTDDELAGVLGANATAALSGSDVEEISGPKRQPDDESESGLLGLLPAPWQRCYISLEIAAALAEAGSDPSSQLKLAAAALEKVVIEPRLHEIADELEQTCALASDLYAQEETRHAYIVCAGAMVIAMSAALPVLSRS
jgi:uncharacterized protein